MIKQMALYSIPAETNGDGFWRYHRKEHAPAVVQACGDNLVKYTLNRVLKTTKGDRACFGVNETWWRDAPAMAAGLKAMDGFKLPNGKSVSEDYFSRLAGENIAFEVEEFVGKPSTGRLQRPPSKYMGFYSIPKDADPRRFWEYHTREHAVHSVDSFGSYLEHYVINRVVTGAPICFGVVELWFADTENLIKGFGAHKNMILPSGKSVSDDFDDRVENSFGYLVEEYKAKTRGNRTGSFYLKFTDSRRGMS